MEAALCVRARACFVYALSVRRAISDAAQRRATSCPSPSPSPKPQAYRAGDSTNVRGTNLPAVKPVGASWWNELQSRRARWAGHGVDEARGGVDNYDDDDGGKEGRRDERKKERETIRWKTKWI